MVDLVGGVTITYNQDIIDPSYAWEDAAATHGFYFHAGTHHLDGKTALAFVRSRKADSDFARAARQQILLIALRKQLTRPSMLPKIPALLKAAAQTVRTDFPAEPGGRHGRPRAGASTTSRSSGMCSDRPIRPTRPTRRPGGIYTLKLKMTKLANLSVKLFGTDSRYYQAPAASPDGIPGALILEADHDSRVPFRSLS